MRMVSLPCKEFKEGLSGNCKYAAASQHRIGLQSVSSGTTKAALLLWLGAALLCLLLQP
jgi:hypothetical protein